MLLKPGKGIQRWDGNKEVYDNMFVAMIKTMAGICVSAGGR
jgi:hypothetical protein